MFQAGIQGHPLDVISSQFSVSVVYESRCSGTHECDNNSECVNSSGSFECECHDGFTKDPTSDVSCIDIDECLTDPCDDTEVCVNTEGGFDCVCHDGFQRDKIDPQKCIDIDECTFGFHNCGVNTRCLNRPGYFQCPCEVGYEIIRNRCTGQGSKDLGLEGTFWNGKIKCILIKI